MRFRFPMWAGSRKRLLSHVLVGAPSDTRWRLRWFDGAVETTFDEVPAQDVQLDIPFSHAALLRLAAHVVDLNEILLVGESGGVQFQVECEDSADWVISHDGDQGLVVKGWFSALQG